MMRSRDYRAIARNALSGFWGISILVAFVAGLLGANGNPFSAASGGSSGRGSTDSASDSSFGAIGGSDQLDAIAPVLLGIAFMLLSLLVVYALATLVIGGAVRLGLVSYNIDLITKRQAPAFKTLFSRFNIFGKAFALNFMMSLFIFLWTLLFIVPGIIATLRYALAPYLMAENPNLGVMEAIRMSKQMMVGNKWRLFKLHFSFIGWGFLGIFTLGIGYLWLTPYIYASEAAFCLDVMRQNLQGGPPYPDLAVSE